MSEFMLALAFVIGVLLAILVALMGTAFIWAAVDWWADRHE